MIEHLHLIVNAKCKDLPNFKEDVSQLEDWMAELVSIIGMKIAVPPRAKYVYDEGNEGPTCVCAITTSHCSIHIWDSEEQPYLRFDLYSCKCFDPNVVLEHLGHFNIFDAKTMYISRYDENTVLPLE